jgi:hypothetical protein
MNFLPALRKSARNPLPPSELPRLFTHELPVLQKLELHVQRLRLVTVDHRKVAVAIGVVGCLLVILDPKLLNEFPHDARHSAPKSNGGDSLDSNPNHEAEPRPRAKYNRSQHEFRDRHSNQAPQDQFERGIVRLHPSPDPFVPLDRRLDAETEQEQQLLGPYIIRRRFQPQLISRSYLPIPTATFCLSS